MNSFRYWQYRGVTQGYPQWMTNYNKFLWTAFYGWVFWHFFTDYHAFFIVSEPWCNVHRVLTWQIIRLGPIILKLGPCMARYFFFFR